MFNWIRRLKHKNTAQDIAHVKENDVILFTNVTFVKNDQHILQQITLMLKEDRIGVIGNNGSGKSSLIKLINGLNLPTDGTIAVFGRDTVRYANILPQMVGFIFQNPDHQIIFPTVLEELMFGLEQLGYNPVEAKQKSMNFLRSNNCEYLAEHPVHTLSEGQKQLICVLSILVMQPRLLILDEPFSSIDLPTRHRLMELIKNLSLKIIMVSHDLQVFEDFDRLIWLHEGRIKLDGTPGSVIAAYQNFAATEPRDQADQWK